MITIEPGLLILEEKPSSITIPRITILTCLNSIVNLLYLVLDNVFFFSLHRSQQILLDLVLDNVFYFLFTNHNKFQLIKYTN